MFKARQGGSSLIEVMVTALILAVGLLGLGLLQIKTVRYNHGAYLRSQATILATDITDRLRINRQHALAGDYNIDYAVAAPAGTSLVAKDLTEWKGLLSQALPNGDGAVSCGLNACSVSVRWIERAGSDAVLAAGADAMQAPVEFVYATRI